MIKNPIVVGGKKLPALTNPGAAADLLAGKQLIDQDGNPLTGTMPSLAAQIITPGTSDQIIPPGQYLSGTQIIKGDANLLAENIKSGMSIFSVEGSYAGVEPVFETLDSANVTLSGNILRFTVAQEIGQLLGATLRFNPSTGANIASYPYINTNLIQFALTSGTFTAFADTTISGKTVTADASGSSSLMTFNGTFNFGCVCYVPK